MIKILEMIKDLRKNNNFNRWHLELMLLALLIMPIIVFIVWITQNTYFMPDPQLTNKAILGICVGVILSSIWFLGTSFIVINLLQEILRELKK